MGVKLRQTIAQILCYITKPLIVKKIILLSAVIAAACSAPEANQSTTAMALNSNTPMETTSFERIRISLMSRKNLYSRTQQLPCRVLVPPYSLF